MLNVHENHTMRQEIYAIRLFHRRKSFFFLIFEIEYLIHKIFLNRMIAYENQIFLKIFIFNLMKM